jgi:rSAM/selenodomain-associated transferase 2
MNFVPMLTVPFRSPKKSRPEAGGPGDKISVIIPTLNEAANIRQLLSSLAGARAGGAEVIVVDGGSSDATVELASPLADAVISSPRGRSNQMNAGAARAHGSIFWFVHADSHLPANASETILRALGDGRHVWGRFDVSIVPGTSLLNLVAISMNWRSWLTGISTGDQATFVRKAAFAEVGGFPAIPLMEDIALSRALKRLSAPACLSEKVETSARRWQKNGTVRTILMMWRLRFAYFLGADPAKLAAIYGYEQNRK